MAPRLKVKPENKRAKPKPAGVRVLYLYAISRKPLGRLPTVASEGIDGSAPVEALLCEGHVCWLSRVAKKEFADGLAENMENLEWLASAGLRHQRVVAEISSKLVALPARFGTVFLREESMAKHVRERRSTLRKAFARVTDADEWGVKIFAAAKTAAPAVIAATSGANYLKAKAALIRPREPRTLDDDVRKFIASLTALSVAACPGGKASAGQPGMVWHGSFLVRRKSRKKLEGLLKKYATKWYDNRRIDWSGPWPPYSFVGEDVR